MKPDPVITALRIVAAIIAAAGTLTTSLALLGGTISLAFALVCLFAFGLMAGALIFGQ
jgi:hypothetical protein